MLPCVLSFLDQNESSNWNHVTCSIREMLFFVFRFLPWEALIFMKWASFLFEPVVII